MIEFLPWSKKVLDRTMEEHKQNRLAVLDLELSAKCTGASCIYCDSKPKVGCAHSQEYTWKQLYDILCQCKELGLEWIYTCGLGEPMEDVIFYNLLDFLSENAIRLSMFTNGLFIKDRYIARALKQAGVCLVLKLDTFEEHKFEKIIGKNVANKIYKANDWLLEEGYGSNDGVYTDMAYSIVPTYFSINGIPEVIRRAKQTGVFASIGELEDAGVVYIKGIKQLLDIDDNEKNKLKILADEYAEGEYKRPICPAILTGIHLDNVGECVVDRISGLNCKWFLLSEPDTHRIGNAKKDRIVELFTRVKEYRYRALIENKAEINMYFEKMPIFGGCGGNIKEVFDLAYRSISDI